MVVDLLPVCTTSSWWQQSLCCEMWISAENPVGKWEIRLVWGHFVQIQQLLSNWTGALPSHTVDTFPSDASCGPSDVAQRWTGKHKKPETVGLVADMRRYCKKKKLCSNLTSRMARDPGSLNDGLHLKLILTDREKKVRRRKRMAEHRWAVRHLLQLLHTHGVNRDLTSSTFLPRYWLLLQKIKSKN